MLEDVLTPTQRELLYKAYKWALFVVGLASAVIGAVNYENASILLWLVGGNVAVNFVGSAIGKMAQDNTNTGA